MMRWQVRALDPHQHLDYVKTLASASFLQCPAWGKVKIDWQGESLGWFSSSGQLEGAGLVLYRRIPTLGYRLAYLPEGPLIDWASADLQAWLNPLISYLKTRKVFAVRIGPPLITRSWANTTIKEALAQPGPHTHQLGELPADEQNMPTSTVHSTLTSLGWQPAHANSAGFAAGQPRYGFQLELEGKSETDLLAGFNQQWRRNIKKAQKAQVQVERVQADHLPIFHRLYTTTAQRDHFTPRPLAYFQRMATQLGAEDPQRFGLYIASRAGVPLAAAITIGVGNHHWYAYGASDATGSEYRPSNAMQWQMIKDAWAAGARVYDMRGITDTLDPNDPLFGLLQFKLGTGGQAVEYLGEWDLPLHRLIYPAFTAYMSRRSRRRTSHPTPEQVNG